MSRPEAFERLALIGCGLMGGSFAMAMRHAGLAREIIGYSPTPATRERALSLRVIDRAAASPAEAVAGADLVLLAVPVAATEATLAQLRSALRPDALLMDVGSTKRNVVAAAQRALGERIATFVPAHPIAGKESAGIAHADANLYRDRLLILTPTESSTLGRLRRAEQLWRALGSRVVTMSPEHHDAAFAAVSHMPHLAAFALIDALAAQPDGAEFLALAGPGFRDTTRIAASDPTVWRDILLGNRDEVLRQSAALRAALLRFEALLENGDPAALQAAIAAASRARAEWRMSGSNADADS